MLSTWTHHLKDPVEKKNFENSIRHSRWILDHLSKLLVDMNNSLEKQELSPKVYDNPNWACRQAHSNGFRQCLSKIQTLINLDHKETDERPISESRPGRTES
jgi:hypothetical protein